MAEEHNPPAHGDPYAGQSLPPWSAVPGQPGAFPPPGRQPPPGAPAPSPSPAPVPVPGSFGAVGGPGYPPAPASGGGSGAPASVRPGIIPLRPLAAGDILDGAFRAIRFNPRATLGLSFLVSLVTAAVSVGVLVWLNDTTSADTVFRVDPSTVVSLLGTAVLTGLLTHVVAEAVLGRKASIGQTWATTKGRLLPLLGYQMLVLFAAVLLAITLIGLLALPLLTFWMLAPAAIVLERQGVGASMRRSAALVKGGFLRTLGILLLVLLIFTVASVVLVLPLTLITAVVAGIGGGLESTLAVSVLAAATTMIANTLLQPFAAAAIVLIYVDRRMRVEGLDVTLARTVQRVTPTGG